MNFSLKNKSAQLWQKLFWRFILFFLVLYIVPYCLGFGFTYKFEEWRLWHTPIFWIGETFMGWDFDYKNPKVGWDSKFEVCRYIFIFFFGLLLSVIWLLLDSFYIKKKYEEKLIALTQTCLRYYLGITMLHYGLAKVFMHQFGTIDISALESSIGENTPMGLMWKYFSFSEAVQQFSGWVETLGAFLLFFRKTTFFGSFLLLVALTNVVLWDIGFSVSVTLYAIQLFLLTLVLMSTQFKSIYTFFSGKAASAVSYKALFSKLKYRKLALGIKAILLLVFGYLFAKDTWEIERDYFDTNYEWFTGVHTINTFVMNGDSLKQTGAPKKWKKLIFNDIRYLNDSFKIEFEDTNAEDERFKFKVDSVTRTIDYRDYEDEKAPWQQISYTQVTDSTYLFKGVFKTDTITAHTAIKRMEDYRLISRKGSWLIDLD